MDDSLVPALGMGTIGPLNRWVGSSAVVLTKQAAIANNCPLQEVVEKEKKDQLEAQMKVIKDLEMQIVKWNAEEQR